MLTSIEEQLDEPIKWRYGNSNLPVFMAPIFEKKDEPADATVEESKTFESQICSCLILEHKDRKTIFHKFWVC
jgi:hypothetical protein